ncbi:hypothetical protein [Bradyrhizobium sp. AZCC 1721]|uniref:hypothetical protein n=1 Tax=Bradyrhizobium sp. AZCC 1721 TaxID=3117016 RepID=UPI002FF0EF95
MPEEGIKAHRFAAVLPKQLLTEASRHRDAVVPADQRAVMRCLGDDLTGLVHDVSHSRIALSGSTSAIQRSTRGFHVRSCARNGAQPVQPCAERLRIAKHVMPPMAEDDNLVHHQRPDHSNSLRLLIRLKSSPRKLIASYWDDLEHEGERTQLALASAVKVEAKRLSAYSPRTHRLQYDGCMTQGCRKC